MPLGVSFHLWTLDSFLNAPRPGTQRLVGSACKGCRDSTSFERAGRRGCRGVACQNKPNTRSDPKGPYPGRLSRRTQCSTRGYLRSPIGQTRILNKQRGGWATVTSIPLTSAKAEANMIVAWVLSVEWANYMSSLYLEPARAWKERASVTHCLSSEMCQASLPSNLLTNTVEGQ